MEAVIDDNFGIREYTYTRKQLDFLALCVQNSDDLSSALDSFLSGWPQEVSVREVLDVWLRFAEKIKNDPNFVDSHFLLSRDNHELALELMKKDII